MINLDIDGFQTSERSQLHVATKGAVPFHAVDMMIKREVVFHEEFVFVLMLSQIVAYLGADGFVLRRITVKLV